MTASTYSNSFKGKPGARLNTWAAAGTPLSANVSPHIMSRTRHTPCGCTSSPVCATNFKCGKPLNLSPASHSTQPASQNRRRCLQAQHKRMRGRSIHLSRLPSNIPFAFSSGRTSFSTSAAGPPLVGAFNDTNKADILCLLQSRRHNMGKGRQRRSRRAPSQNLH